MPKHKTNKGVAKRVKVTKNGKVLRSKAGRRHLLSSKTTKRKRNMRRKDSVVGNIAESYKSVINK
jgi:ribosomal protein L35